ncbi:MAG: beta-N-acetylhexosaminidase [Nitrospiraceae bacterium]
MLTREQIGQLFMLGFLGTSVTQELASFITTYKPGGLILFRRNLESVEQIVRLTNDLQQLSPHSPLLISIDQEGGRVSRLPSDFTIFPPCASLGACGSYDLAYAAAAVTATELRTVGINMNMAPVLDVHTNPANPIIGDRAFGSDPVQVGDLGEATFKGLQDNRVVACGNHFPGHGDTIADSHKELPQVTASRQRLETVELPPFHHAFQRGLASLMTAHVLYPALDEQLPATLSPTILTDLLRGQMGFDGLILTDDLEMRAILDHYGIGEASIRAFRAGADVLLICKEQGLQVDAMDAFTNAVHTGTIPQARVEASLRRVALIKERFLRPYKPADLLSARVIVGNGSHRAMKAQLIRSSTRLTASA